ncbi:MAG: hypothetical protein F6K16_06080 [Symploca sp. SIO2B6]|nr:hypothetical protein [Symploca sp. SIO2B6]
MGGWGDTERGGWGEGGMGRWGDAETRRGGESFKNLMQQEHIGFKCISSNLGKPLVYSLIDWGRTSQ